MRKAALRTVFAGLFLLAGVGAPALAKPDKGSEHSGNHPRPHSYEEHGPSAPRPGPGDGADVHVIITDGDIGIIHGYYADHPYAPEGLPPGIAKNLERGKPLPPGIAKRYPPQPLLERLPPRPGCDWMLVGPHVVLVARDTGLIIDIAFDVFH